MLQARRLGRELVVGVHSDQDIMDNKGPPVMTLKERWVDPNFAIAGIADWKQDISRGGLPVVYQLRPLCPVRHCTSLDNALRLLLRSSWRRHYFGQWRGGLLPFCQSSWPIPCCQAYAWHLDNRSGGPNASLYEEPFHQVFKPSSVWGRGVWRFRGAD